MIRCRSLFVLLAIVLSVLQFPDSDYPFGIFKIFLYCIKKVLIRQVYITLANVCYPLYAYRFTCSESL
jgi:hypothetical protein